MTTPIEAAFSQASDIRAEGWDHEVASGGHVVDALVSAGNGNFGDAAVSVAQAVNETYQAQLCYNEANTTELHAAQEHIQANYDANGGSLCNIL